MSAIHPKADIDGARWNVRFGPTGDIGYSITSSARPSNGSGTVTRSESPPGTAPAAMLLLVSGLPPMQFAASMRQG
jgi:hypothetical protein